MHGGEGNLISFYGIETGRARKSNGMGYWGMNDGIKNLEGSPSETKWVKLLK